jgi:CHAD domain
MKRKIQNSILRYGDEVKRYSHKISPHFKAATIHRFRTATKKLRSLLRWQHTQKETLPASFVKIYHASGDLRNAQLLLVSLNKDKINLPGFILWLATHTGNLQLDWNGIYNKRKFRKLKRKLSNTMPQKTGKKALQLFFSKKIHKLQTIIKLPAPTDDMLHEVRKILKDMQYVKQWCKKKWPAGNNAIRKVSLLQLKKLGELAGNYNDKRTGLLLIATYQDEEKDGKAITAARIIQKKLQQQNVKLKKQLLHSLLQFSKSAAFLFPLK